jgi:hypothetical protein
MSQGTNTARRKLLAGLCFGVPALMVTSSPAFAFQGKKRERHPHIRAAIRELREAKKELEHAAHDFGGHRVEAIEAVNVAIKQLEKALQYDKA